MMDRLSDPDFGWNAQSTLIADSMGVEALSIDFGATSQQFYQAYISAEAVEASAPKRYPLASLFAIRSENRNINQGQLFSGLVTVGFDVHITWSANHPPKLGEVQADLVESTMIRLFNDSEWQGAFEAPACFLGQIQILRTPITVGAKHWRQTIQSRLTWQVDLLG
jgi:hypothetical protein